MCDARAILSYRRVGRSVVFLAEGAVEHTECLQGLLMPLDGGLDSLEERRRRTRAEKAEEKKNKAEEERYSTHEYTVYKKRDIHSIEIV